MSNDAPAATPESDAAQAATPTDNDRVQIGLRVDESKLQTSYANAFRTHHTAEEVVFDLGMNVTTPRPASPQADGDKPGEPRRLADVTFNANHRVVMNYYTAKRLALSLAEIVRRHEQAFGELELDTQKRRKG